jgi:hypothetical protein
VLNPIGEEIWDLRQDIRVPGGILLPSRTIVFRLAQRKLLLWSPVAIDDEDAKAVDALGEVAWVVAPSRIHFFFFRAALERWPQARALGAAGLEKKIPGVAFDPLPESGMIAGELRVQRIEGFPYIDEHVFSRDKTLLVTDLLFNVQEARGFAAPIFLRAVGTWKKPAQSRLWRVLLKDREAARRTLGEVLAWDFDRVVMAHGDDVVDDAHGAVKNALAWLCP